MSLTWDKVWMPYVSKSVCLCGLCGNTGVIDTRGRAVSPAGIDAGGRYWCICPNGRALKRATKKERPDD